LQINTGCPAISFAIHRFFPPCNTDQTLAQFPSIQRSSLQITKQVFIPPSLQKPMGCCYCPMKHKCLQFPSVLEINISWTQNKRVVYSTGAYNIAMLNFTSFPGATHPHLQEVHIV
jgi:hypothetical protein